METPHQGTGPFQSTLWDCILFQVPPRQEIGGSSSEKMKGLVGLIEGEKEKNKNIFGLVNH